MSLLINEIAGHAASFVLVLDDFHLIQNEQILEMLDLLLKHMPLQMHLVFLSRTDPPLPLARLRARFQLLEIRASQLRFTPDEMAIFLNKVMGLKLSASDIAALEARTEGWIAGIQLAALSMQGIDDVHVLSRRSLAAMPISWTTWLKKCSRSSLRECARSCYTLQSWIGCVDRCVRLSSQKTKHLSMGKGCWKSWKRRIYSSSRWTTSGAGFATITLADVLTRRLEHLLPANFLICTAALPIGTKRMLHPRSHPTFPAGRGPGARRSIDRAEWL